jgi:hypothetical protein
MEKTSIPHIVYNKDTAQSYLAIKLSQKFTPESTYPKEKDILSHQSSEIKRIHSHSYLHNLDKHPSAMLAAINNKMLMSLYPNFYSKTHFTPMLDNVSTTLAATECVISIKDNIQPNYAISLAEGYSFAGHNHSNNGDVYAPIPIAAAYALNIKDAIKHILIIDENVTPETAQYYFEHGNGSIFFQNNNQNLSTLFQNKVGIHHNILNTLGSILNHNTIDLVFYNINIDNIEPMDGFKPAEVKNRNYQISSLFEHSIPTVFIFSGDKNKNQDDICSLIKYIAKTAQNVASSKEKIDGPEIVWQQKKDNFINAAQSMMNYLEEYRSTIPIPSPTQSAQDSSSYSQSSSLSDNIEHLEEKRTRLKQKIVMATSADTAGYLAVETSSSSTNSTTEDCGNDSLSCSETIEDFEDNNEI